MQSARTPIFEAALDLAWSQWTALGVRGIAQPAGSAVDPEALLYFTACLADQDPRLQAEVADWCNQFGRYISRPRMNALASRFSENVRAKLATLETAVETEEHKGKSRLDHLDTSARSLLRLRCVFGANARAEVLLELLTRGARSDDGLTALALSEVGYSKRNIAIVLDELRLAGLLVAAREGNRIRYRLANPDALKRVLGPLPSFSSRWHLRLPILAAFVELAERLHGRDALVQSVEARKTLEGLRSSITAAGITAPALSAAADTYWPALQQWLIDHVIVEESDSLHRVARMIEGVWLAPNGHPRRPQRATSAILPRGDMNPAADAELICLDLVQVPTVEPAGDWAWAVLSTAATSTYSHTSGLDSGEPWRFVTWHFGEERTYAVEAVDSLPHESIGQAYGRTAASRARADRPAIQLRLRRLDPEA